MSSGTRPARSPICRPRIAASSPSPTTTANSTLIFGDGEHGARLPTGVLNVASVYRRGIGAPGNVRAEQLSLLMTRPLGVKAVINPLRASGGADKESRDLARENAPLSVMALDRLVSIEDYADFTRGFAGIAKARAQQSSDGRRPPALPDDRRRRRRPDRHFIRPLPQPPGSASPAGRSGPAAAGRACGS